MRGFLRDDERAELLGLAARRRTARGPGESEDATIAHLAVGWNAGQIKVGSITRGERTAKWNEVLRIEEALAGRAGFAGLDAIGFRRA